MSYVRWSSDRGPHDYVSDVYIYDDISGGITCCGCVSNMPTVEDAIEHVQKHIDGGDRVPSFVIPRIRNRQAFN